MKRKLTTQEFIERAKEVHGNKYDYSKVEYKNNREKVCIICPIHGEFWQTPNNHLKGKGCKKCSEIVIALKRSKGVTNFINESVKKHNGKYDYSKVEYKNNREKVCIICPIHGEFWQTPAAHLRGQECPKCAHRSIKYETQEFINKAKKLHNNKYDYSKVEYKNNREKVCIICPIHGEFWQTPAAHLRGQGCKKCANVLNGQTKMLGVDKFIERAKAIHGDKYDYSKVEYKNNREKVCIICPKHGEFWQAPIKHLYGQGCPVCRDSFLEDKLKIFLTENKINYKHQYSVDWLVNENGNSLSLDFYLPEYNIGIECQGIQHFKHVEHFGGEKMFKRRILNDTLKKKLCLEHNIKILYVIEKNIKTEIKLYDNDNIILLDEVTVEKIKDTS